ncbi:hypothetical protein [Halobellus salinus]|nr:hypothetical protein [Halobellus salinus]SMP13048.1 hypothetical protein SAMN06265347_104138 [Halobellus salinus]
MTDPASTHDAFTEDSGGQRQHAPADVAPELYGSTDVQGERPTAEPR